MKDVAHILLALVQEREQPVLRYSKQFYHLDQINARLTDAVAEAKFLAAYPDDIYYQKLYEFSELIAAASRCVREPPPHSSFYQLAWKQQYNMIMFKMEIVQQWLYKITAIRVVEAPVYLQSQDDSVEITAQSMQLQEKPAANMQQVNNILRDIRSTYKVTNALIHAYGESLWRIEAGVDDATDNVYNANKHFLKALKNVRGYWKYILLIFAVIAVYLVFKALWKKL